MGGRGWKGVMGMGMGMGMVMVMVGNKINIQLYVGHSDVGSDAGVYRLLNLCFMLLF